MLENDGNKSGVVIQCAWCGKLIHSGDSITLYEPPPWFQIPWYALIYTRNPMRLVGCLRPDCCFAKLDNVGVLTSSGNLELKKTRLSIL